MNIYTQGSNFVLKGDFSCPTSSNTITKAYHALATVASLPKGITIEVEKNIPEGSGLGGGSSNAAALLLALNESLELDLTPESLQNIGLQVGADVPFFLSRYDSANVSGIGEIIESYEEILPKFELAFPPIPCDTAAVYRCYAASHYHPLSSAETGHWFSTSSRDHLHNATVAELNDLFAPAVDLHPELQDYAKDGWFFSGSGSTFFRMKAA